MIRTAAGLALLFTSLTLIAQSVPSTSSGTFGVAGQETVAPGDPQVLKLPGGTVFMYPNVVLGCPIGMHASQSLWNHNIAVQKGLGNEKYGQRISLNLSDSHSAKIIGAQVRVRGLNGKNRMLLTPTGTNQPWNATTTLNVKFVEEKDGSVTADMWIPGFTSVHSIRLLEITYADGSNWKSTGANGCRVQPDPVMLITER